jgi:hypothetical protein
MNISLTAGTLGAGFGHITEIGIDIERTAVVGDFTGQIIDTAEIVTIQGSTLGNNQILIIEQDGDVAIFAVRNVYIGQNATLVRLGGAGSAQEIMISSPANTGNATAPGKGVKAGDMSGIHAGPLRRIMTEAFLTAFNSHTHSGVTLGADSTGPPNVTVTPDSPPQTCTTSFAAN